MRVHMGVAIAAILALAGSLRAAPLNLEHVAADAKWVAHLDVDAVRDSAVADMASEHWKQKHPEAEIIMSKIFEVWRFDPRTDLHGVTIYGAQLKKDTGVAIVQAKVDQELLLEKARKAPEHQETTYGQYQLHTWKDHRKGKMTGVFFRPDVIVFGRSIDEVKAALDVLDGTKPNLAGKNSPLAAAIPQGTILLARAIGLDEAKLPCKSPLAKQIDAISVAIGEYQGESFFKGKVAVKNAELAGQMKDVVVGLRAMAMIANWGDDETLKLINNLNVHVEGNLVDVEWHAPAEKVWALMKKIEERKASKFWRHHGRPGRPPAKKK